MAKEGYQAMRLVAHTGLNAGLCRSTLWIWRI